MFDNILIGKRIKEARLQKKYRQDDVATAIGVATSTIARYERGKIERVKLPIIEAIARYLEVEPGWIMGNTISPESQNTPSTEKECVHLPILGHVAAGAGCFADNQVISTTPVPSYWIKTKENYVFLKVCGDSMYPEFQENDLVLVKIQPSVDSGHYAVALVDDENGVIKKIVYGADWIELLSVNPMYPPRRFEGAEVQRVRIFGLVKKTLRNYL